MKTYSIGTLETSLPALADAVNLLSASCPGESDRYGKNRLEVELMANDCLPFYKKFFGAYDSEGVLIGVGGIKAADWASDTHLLYMMAVAERHRGKGVGSALERARIEWVTGKFPQGRCLVSTKHRKRFERWNFVSVSEINNRHLMLLEF